MTVEESLEAHRRVLSEYFESEWVLLSPSEKALCMNYKRQLLSDMPVSNELILKVNDIHEKYPDFHMGCVP